METTTDIALGLMSRSLPLVCEHPTKIVDYQKEDNEVWHGVHLHKLASTIEREATPVISNTGGSKYISPARPSLKPI
jgi:hypothetical protein